MKSKLTDLRVCLYEKMMYIVGYKVELRDNLNQEVLDFVTPLTIDGYMTPVQFACLLSWVGDRHKWDDSNIYHTMRDFLYPDDLRYPNLEINGQIALKYDIPKTIIDMDKMQNEADIEQWVDFISELHTDYYASYKEDHFGLKARDYIEIMAEGSGNLPSYMTPKKLKESKSVESWDEQDDSEQMSLLIEEEEPENEYAIALNKEPFFSYDREVPNLYIPAPGSIPLPCFKTVQNLLQVIQFKYGFAMSLSGLFRYNEICQNQYNVYYESLLKDYNVSYFDPEARKLSKDPLGKYLYTFLGEDIGAHLKGDQLQCNQDIIKRYAAKYGKGSLQEDPVKAEHIDRVLAFLSFKSKLKQVKELIMGTIGTKPNYQRLDDIDRLICRATINNDGETRRFNTKDPGIQSKNKDIRALTVGREPGRKIAAVDIKAQELTLLIFGIMENKELQRLTLELGSGYHAFAKYAGIEFNQETKKLIKVPILEVMNGGSLSSILADMEGHEDIGRQIHSIIFDDPGYSKIYQHAVAESKKYRHERLMRRGIFGTVVPIYKSGKFGENEGTRRRQIINSSFQLSASEIFAYCIHAMIYDLVHQTNKWGFTLDDITPIIPIHDEMLFDISGDLDEKDVRDFIRFYMAPRISDWGAMVGEITIGDHYIGKEGETEYAE